MPATAPRTLAWARKSLASKRSPRSATNRSPGSMLRLSLWTRRKPIASLAGAQSTQRALPSHGCTCCKVVMSDTGTPVLNRRCVPNCQRPTHLVNVRERPPLACHLLIVFMTLARDQQHIVGTSPGQRIGNCPRPVGLNVHGCITTQAQQYLTDDGIHLFAARIVTGHQHPVGMAGRNRPHQGSVSYTHLRAHETGR